MARLAELIVALLPYLGIAAVGSVLHGYCEFVFGYAGEWYRAWQDDQERPEAPWSEHRRARLGDEFPFAVLRGIPVWFVSGMVYALVGEVLPERPGSWLYAGLGGVASVGVLLAAHWGAWDPVPARAWSFVLGAGLAEATRQVVVGLFRADHGPRQWSWFPSRGRHGAARSSRPQQPRRTRLQAAESAASRRRLGDRWTALRQVLVSQEVELTPALLNEVYAMLKADPLAYARAQRTQAAAGAITGLLLAAPALWFTRTWLLRNPDRSPVGGGMWWAVNGVTLCGAVIVVLMVVEMILDAAKDLAEEQKRVAGEAAKAYAARVTLRTKTRQFAERMEDEYGWMLEMDENHQKQRALQWYEKIIDAWHRENVEWGDLRGPDERDLVIEDLNRDQQGLGSRMLRIWARRRTLYQYAIAYATPEERAAEAERLEEANLQAQARAKARERVFGKTLREDAAPAGEEWDRI